MTRPARGVAALTRTLTGDSPEGCSHAPRTEQRRKEHDRLTLKRRRKSVDERAKIERKAVML